MIDTNSQHLQLAISANDIVRAKESGKVAIVFGVEGGSYWKGTSTI